MEEWKRFVEFWEEFFEWIWKVEVYFERDENVYGFMVSELEEQIDKYKVRNNQEVCIFEWRGDGRFFYLILVFFVSFIYYQVVFFFIFYRYIIYIFYKIVVD